MNSGSKFEKSEPELCENMRERNKTIGHNWILEKNAHSSIRVCKFDDINSLKRISTVCFRKAKTKRAKICHVIEVTDIRKSHIS